MTNFGIMTSSPLRGFGQQDRATCSIRSSTVNPAAPARATNSAANLAELPLAFGLAVSTFLFADERAGALLGFEHAADFQLAIGAHHGVGIDGQVHRHLAHGGQLVAGSQRAGGHAAAHLVDDLAVDGHAAVQVQAEVEGLSGDGCARFMTLDN